MKKALGAVLMLFSSGVLACSDPHPHEYVETSRTRISADITAVVALSGQYSHLVNVSARLPNGHAAILTIPGEGIAPDKQLIVEEVVLEDLLKNGDPVVKYDFVGTHAD